ncbi:M23 family metallopeptidase [Actinomyces slackii]|nr:M23 family metallopeptidase [Actinomyces slackii]
MAQPMSQGQAAASPAPMTRMARRRMEAAKAQQRPGQTPEGAAASQARSQTRRQASLQAPQTTQTTAPRAPQAAEPQTSQAAEPQIPQAAPQAVDDSSAALSATPAAVPAVPATPAPAGAQDPWTQVAGGWPLGAPDASPTPRPSLRASARQDAPQDDAHAEPAAVAERTEAQPTASQDEDPEYSWPEKGSEPREIRFSRELEEFRRADTVQVPELTRKRRAAREAANRRSRSASRGPSPARPSAGRRGVGVLGRTAVLTVLAVATVIAPVSGYLTNAALASQDSESQAQPRATTRSSSVAAAVLGSDADWDDEGEDALSNVPDAATRARIREAYQNAAKTCSSETGASGDTAAFASAPELFYPMLPDTYTISSEYGYRIHPTLGILKLHAGQDFSAPVGTAIYAVAGGTVTTAGMVDGTGTITIKHEIDGQTWYSSYLHMYEDGIHVKAGDTVTAGQHIAGVGNTGRSSGPHLHFEIRTADDTADESTVEPWGWLQSHKAVELTTDCS